MIQQAPALISSRRGIEPRTTRDKETVGRTMIGIDVYVLDDALAQVVPRGDGDLCDEG
jgi:hypothetical protein